MAHDVFISYAIEDRRIAEAIAQQLEQRGVTCWYAPRDVPFGVDYEEAIVDAICVSQVVILILSSYSNDSPHVRREIQNACAEQTPIPILPVRVEDVQLNKALKYYLSSAQWLDASTAPVESHIPRLVEQLSARLSQPAAAEDYATERSEATKAPRGAEKQWPAHSVVVAKSDGARSEGATGEKQSQPFVAVGRTAVGGQERGVGDDRPTTKRTPFATIGRKEDYTLFARLTSFVPSWGLLKRTLLIVFLSSLLPVAGVLASFYIFYRPSPYGEIAIIGSVILGFLLIEGLVIYFYSKRFRRGRLLVGVVFVCAMIGGVAVWHNSWASHAFIYVSLTDVTGAAVNGAKVELRLAGSVISTAETTINGTTYLYCGPGNYTIRIVPPPGFSEYTTFVRVDRRYVDQYIQLESSATKNPK
jgi:TIR domain-containing protein